MKIIRVSFLKLITETVGSSGKYTGILFVFSQGMMVKGHSTKF